MLLISTCLVPTHSLGIWKVVWKELYTSKHTNTSNIFLSYGSNWKRLKNRLEDSNYAKLDPPVSPPPDTVLTVFLIGSSVNGDRWTHDISQPSSGMVWFSGGWVAPMISSHSFSNQLLCIYWIICWSFVQLRPYSWSCFPVAWWLWGCGVIKIDPMTYTVLIIPRWEISIKYRTEIWIFSTKISTKKYRHGRIVSDLMCYRACVELGSGDRECEDSGPQARRLGQEPPELHLGPPPQQPIREQDLPSPSEWPFDLCGWPYHRCQEPACLAGQVTHTMMYTHSHTYTHTNNDTAHTQRHTPTHTLRTHTHTHTFTANAHTYIQTTHTVLAHKQTFTANTYTHTQTHTHTHTQINIEAHHRNARCLRSSSVVISQDVLPTLPLKPLLHRISHSGSECNIQVWKWSSVAG